MWEIMPSQNKTQQCVFCTHTNNIDRSFCENCDSLLSNYFYLQKENKRQDSDEEEAKISFSTSFEETYKNRESIDFENINRSLYASEWKALEFGNDSSEKKASRQRDEILVPEEIEFENDRAYHCSQCGHLKPFANPCPSCQYPLQLIKSTSLLVSIREILSGDTKIGFQSLLNDRYLHFRPIATAGDLDSISEGAQAGLNPVVVPRKQHPSLYITGHYHQHIQNKEVRLFNNSQVEDGFYPLFDLRHYPYTYQSRVAAYMIPKDIRIGEVVLLEDIIEDFIGALRPNPRRLPSAPAIWDGARMVVLYSRENDVVDESV